MPAGYRTANGHIALPSNGHITIPSILLPENVNDVVLPTFDDKENKQYENTQGSYSQQVEAIPFTFLTENQNNPKHFGNVSAEVEENLCLKCKSFEITIFNLESRLKEMQDRNKQLADVNKTLSEALKAAHEKEKDHIKQLTKLDKVTKIIKEKWPRAHFIENMKQQLQGTLSSNQIDLILGIRRAVKWSKQELSAAFTLKYFSQRAYRYICTDLNYPLPSIRTLQRYASKLDLKQGILEDIITFIGFFAQTLAPRARECVLSFDEMKVSRILEYDPSADEVVGPFNYLQVVMIRGLFKQWKQPIFIAFDTKMTKTILLDIISRLSDKMINVVAIVSDNCQTNIGCWKELGARDDIERPFFIHPKTKKNIYVVPDAPHLLKLLRNWLLDHGFEHNGRIIEAGNLLRLVATRNESEMTPVFKLTTSHVDMTPQERQNVRRAAELLSRTTAIALRRYFPENDSANILADFVEKVDLWFSISNSYTPYAKLDFKKSYIANDYQLQALKDMHETISHMTIPGKNRMQVFQHSMLMQIKSLQMVYADMKTKHGITFISTHKLNQDVLENFFSQLRQMGGVNDHPSPLSCLYRIRIMILGKSPSILQNQTTTIEAVNNEQEEFITTTDGTASDVGNNDCFISASMFCEAEIDPILPNVEAMEAANNFTVQDGEFTAADKYYTNGGPKLRGWTNGGMQDHQSSTLSRPRSAEVITANGNGTLPNGRHVNGVLTRAPGGLHEDLEFPPTLRTLSKKKQIVWMRPHDMCARPQFRIAPPGTPLTARELPEPVGPGDPSLLAALGCLSQLPRLLERVVPPEQTFDTANGYCGMFKFRFWQWGKWIEVRVDDRLPTRGDRPAHMHCAQPDIFWAALLEKAYAKLYGGYTFLKYGTVGRALQDLTGAVVQSVPPSGPLLGGAVPRSTLLIAISGVEKETKRRRSGLLTEHPYCVTGLARVRANSTDSVTHGSGSSSGDTSLIRLRSPWIGGEWGGVWCGAWSERSWEWNALNERDRELLSSRSSNDCEFWMSVNEFLTRFVVIWLAHIGPDDWALEPGLHTRAPWRAALAVRQWRAGFNAGGPHRFIETTATNPQFRIRVPPGHPSKAHVVVAVAQKYECYRSRNYEEEEIGFTIYEVPPGMQRVTPQYVSEQMPLDFAPLSNLREIATFFALPAGDFVVMPHAAQHREGRFLLRIFADQHTDVWEVNEENLVIHNIAAEFCDERTIDARILYKLRARYPHEIDATQLQAILKAHGGNNRGFRGLGGINCSPSLELCRGMLALRDPALGGRLSIEHVPALIGLMRFWKAAFRRCGPSSSGTATLSRGIWASKVSSYCLRGLLWAGGATASNKVLEALVSRFTRNRQITLEGYLLSMARLHLAHERYHSLDAKAKASPLSLEEMILMTIYS